MTKEEAIKCINNVLYSDYHYDESLGYQLTSDDFEWLELAIEALQEPERKKGHWEPFFEDVEIFNTGGFTKRKQTGWVCDRCKAFSFYCANYCSDCGADMRGDQE